MTRSTEKLIHAALRDGCREHCDALIDELRRLVAEHEEDQRVIAVWRGRTQRAEAQRDALLEALNQCLKGTLIGGHTHNDNGLEVLAERCGSPHVATELRRLAGIARATIRTLGERK